MKYVIYKKRGSQLLAVVMASETAIHADLMDTTEFVPVSAGFCAISTKTGHIKLDYRGSESLNLKPHECDKMYLNRMLAGNFNTATNIFIDYNDDYPMIPRTGDPLADKIQEMCCKHCIEVSGGCGHIDRDDKFYLTCDQIEEVRRYLQK